MIKAVKKLAIAFLYSVLLVATSGSTPSIARDIEYQDTDRTDYDHRDDHFGHTKRPVDCASLRALRDLGDELVLIKNPRTGDSLDYVVVGDAALNSQLVVMFNGTGTILTDWPIQMITNKTYSPKIVNTNAYLPSQNGPISLCHNYRLVLFDYPGVGNGRFNGSFTSDQIANDVDAMLDDISVRYKIQTNDISVLGWSLGTELALKYAFLSPVSNPDRLIDNLVLIATRPGGNTDGFQDGNQAQCISYMLDTLETVQPHTSLARMLESNSYRLTFPFVDQQPYSGIESGCNASIINNRLSLTVTPNCPEGGECEKNLRNFEVNRETPPWSKTGGVNQALFAGERQSSNDYDICYCPVAGTDFTSMNCTCSGTVDTTEANGGVCQTVSTGITTPNLPISTNCVPLNFAGKLTVINGFEDLYIQWTYGQALVSGMQQTLGADKAVLVTYSGSDGAGHGVLLQHPRWTQQQIFVALHH
jgi:pimeloyl-ACP methyl ester carboxylesterase